MVYARGSHLGNLRFNPGFPQTGKCFTFAAVFKLMGLSNAHTKCKETLLVLKLVISMLFTPRVMLVPFAVVLPRDHTFRAIT